MRQEQTDKYFTIEQPSEGIYKEKGSKFLAFAYPVFDEEQIKEYQAQLKKKYYDSRHQVYAFRLGADMKTYRCSDDGEPSNSSGPPVLGQIKSFELTNILIVVVRYFGGVKLGVSGLINAYKTAANDAINNSKIVERFEEDVFTIKFDYSAMNDVMKILKAENPTRLAQDFSNTCTIKLSVRKTQSESLRSRLCGIEGVELV